MKQIVLCLMFAASPLLAEETPAPNEGERGISLMQQGAELLLNHMMSKVEPSLQDMAEALRQAQPKITEILAMIDDIRNYHAPEKLPNGDIILRRKTPAELKLEELPGTATDL
jgi:hypothetical protein